jgi:diacylglycerol kinase family enzyme
VKLAVLLNPFAGRARRDPGLPGRLRALLGERGALYISSPVELPALSATLCARGVDLIALCGGDGTGQATLTELTRAYRAAGARLPPIALLGGGTVNTVAHNLGVRGAPEAVLTRLLDAAACGALPSVAQPLLAVNGRHGFLFAAALGARFLELYYDAPSPGPTRAALLAARVAGSAAVGGALSRRLFRPARTTLSIDGEAALRLDARLLVASTVADVGVGMRICPRASSAPGRFQLVASALPPSVMARQLPAVLAGRALDGAPELHVDRLAVRAELVFDDDEPYTLDGDLFRARAVTIAHAGTLSIVRA